jgi:bisphosphoglycerate-independent phosphoglycerate mutase (AlkP superfamily)
MSKSESEENSSGDEDFESQTHLFRSSLDVGSHFIDIQPENELVFYNNQGTMLTQLTIKNTVNKAHVAFFVSDIENLKITFRFSPLLPTPLGYCLRTVSSHPCISKSSKSDGKLVRDP